MEKIVPLNNAETNMASDEIDNLPIDVLERTNNFTPHITEDRRKLNTNYSYKNTNQQYYQGELYKNNNNIEINENKSITLIKKKRISFNSFNVENTQNQNIQDLKDGISIKSFSNFSVEHHAKGKLCFKDEEDDLSLDGLKLNENINQGLCSNFMCNKRSVCNICNCCQQCCNNDAHKISILQEESPFQKNFKPERKHSFSKSLFEFDSYRQNGFSINNEFNDLDISQWNSVAPYAIENKYNLDNNNIFSDNFNVFGAKEKEEIQYDNNIFSLNNVDDIYNNNYLENNNDEIFNININKPNIDNNNSNNNININNNLLNQPNKFENLYSNYNQVNNSNFPTPEESNIINKNINNNIKNNFLSPNLTCRLALTKSKSFDELGFTSDDSYQDENILNSHGLQPFTLGDSKPRKKHKKRVSFNLPPEKTDSKHKEYLLEEPKKRGSSGDSTEKEKRKFNGNPINKIIQIAKEEKNENYKKYLCNQSEDNYIFKAIKNYDENYENGVKSNILNDNFAKLIIKEKSPDNSQKKYYFFTSKSFNSEDDSNTINKVNNNNLKPKSKEKETEEIESYTIIVNEHNTNTNTNDSSCPSKDNNNNHNRNHKNKDNSNKPKSRESSKSKNTNNSKKNKQYCNCKNSNCLKLYCDCFKFGRYCKPQLCSCLECFNNHNYEILRQKSIKHLQNKTKHAFKPKFVYDQNNDKLKHIIGCSCKNSSCLKNYCECFQNNLKCTSSCRCMDCRNFDIDKIISSNSNNNNANIKKLIDMNVSNKNTVEGDNSSSPIQSI